MLRKTILNVITGLLYTVISTFTSIFVTNIIINRLGSEINGIYQTSNQFVNFFSILEGGYVLSAVVAMYGPFHKGEYTRINVIYSTVSQYLRKIGTIFLVVSALAAGIYIFLIDTDYNRFHIFLMFFISALNLSIILSFQLRLSVLFEATQMEYYIKVVNIGISLLTFIGILYCYITDRIDPVLMKGILLLGTVVGVIALTLLSKRIFPEVRLVKEYDKDAIKGSRDIFIQKIAATINQSLDMVLLTSMSLPVYSSIYSIYNMIFNFAKVVGDSLCLAPNNGIGRIYSIGNKQETEDTFDLYETNLFFFYSVIFVTVAAIAKAFIRLYIYESYQYIDNGLLFLFTLMFYLNCMNKPAGSMINISGKYGFQKKTITISVAINLCLSVLLIGGFHIYGVVAATVCSYLFLIPFNIYYNSKYVICRSIFVSIRKLLFHSIAFLASLFAVLQIEFDCKNYIQLFFAAVVVGAAVLIMYIVFELVFFRKAFLINYKIIIALIKRILS